MRHLRIFHGVLAVAGLSLFFHPLQAQDPVRTLEDVRKLEAKLTSVAEHALPATVALISVETGASGSGVITTPDGLILTAAHVVEGNERVEVVFPNGKRTTAKVLGANLSKDIALAKIQDSGPWPYIEMGQSKPLKAGDWVVAMGHSAGYDPARTPPVRFGRVVSDGPGNFLTTDCSLIGGDSGGPLFGIDGKVVAVNSSIGESIRNNNHAGVDGFREDWDRLMKSEIWGELQMNPLANQERPVMGIRVSERVAEGGVLVAGVTPGTPAATAGIRTGDLIQTINGAKVRAGRYFFLQIAKFRPGDTIKVGLVRDSNTIQTDVKLVQASQLGQSAPISRRLNFDDDEDSKVDVPLMTREEEETIRQESEQLYGAIKPATTEASHSTVWVWGKDRRGEPLQVAQGTVIGDGRQILTKFSEIWSSADDLSVVAGDSKTAKAKISGVYSDYDLAVLDLEAGVSFPPVKWDTTDKLELGRFVVAPNPDDLKPVLGVVAVQTRSTRAKDQAFLGVELDGKFQGPGVKIRGVESDGAAQNAGLLEGDIITGIGGKPVNSAYEMRTSLNGHGPGERIEVEYQRDGKAAKVDALLKERPDFRQPLNNRLETMRQMGTHISSYSGPFPAVVQADIPIAPNLCGGPITDLDGKVVGVSIARPDRTSSMLIPASTLAALLETKASSPQEAQANVNSAREEEGDAPGMPPSMRRGGPQRMEQNSAESLRQNLMDMEDLLQRMKREMQDVGE